MATGGISAGSRATLGMRWSGSRAAVVSSADLRPILPTLRIVDATMNAKGFEHAFTRKLAEAVQQTAGWTVTSIDRVDSLAALAGVGALEEDALMLVAHGAGTDEGNQLGRVILGTDRVNWYLAASALEVHGKALFLVVCEGLNEDAIAGILREQFPKVIVGVPGGQKISTAQALKFFPTMLKYVTVATPRQVAAAVKLAGAETLVPVTAWEGLE